VLLRALRLGPSLGLGLDTGTELDRRDLRRVRPGQVGGNRPRPGVLLQPLDLVGHLDEPAEAVLLLEVQLQDRRDELGELFVPCFAVSV
jgi:hypothetical protein